MNSEPDYFKRIRSVRGLMDQAVNFASRFPHSKARARNTTVVKNIHYLNSGMMEHRLDVIRMRDAEGFQPTMLYIHGGAFAACSKETHEILTYQYARMGFTVFSIDYRLMPEHRFPAAFHDSCAALLWVLEHGESYGADLSQLVIAGESAGGNLTLGLAAASAYRDNNDAWAKRVFDANPNIAAAIPACGVLQVSGIQRLWRRGDCDPITRTCLSLMQRDYLPHATNVETPLLWADPLLVVERRSMQRDLPAIFAFCGTADPLVDDTVRLDTRLSEIGADRHRCEFSEGENHAFHAFLWRQQAKKVWAQQREYLGENVQGLRVDLAAE